MSRTDYAPNILKFLKRKEQRKFKLVSRVASRASEEYLGDHELIEKLKRLLDTPIPAEFRVPPPDDFDNEAYNFQEKFLGRINTIRELFIEVSTRSGSREVPVFIFYTNYIRRILFMIFVYFGLVEGEIITNHDSIPVAELSRDEFDIFKIIPGFTVLFLHYQPKGKSLEYFEDIISPYMNIMHTLALKRFGELQPLPPIHRPRTSQEINYGLLIELSRLRSRQDVLMYF
jgi:hypothetical protein